jgi:gliding motility-associated-like protein
MKKITLLLLLLLLSISGYSQMAVEGFESTTGPDALPSTNWTLGTGNWAVFDNGIGLVQRWGINSTVTTPPIVYQGANAAYVSRENIGQNNTSEDFLATPLVTIPTNGQLHFYTRSFSSANQGTIYQIRVTPASAGQTNVPAYSTIQQWTEAQLTATFNIYEEKVVNLSAFAGQQVYVAFVMVYNQLTTTLGGDRWLVDDVSIVEQCLDPTNLVATNIGLTSANLSWGNPSGATSWEIEVLPAASPSTGVGIIYNGTLPYVATTTATGTPLTPSTAYVYYVRALCSATHSSWIGPLPFTTASPGTSCSAPIQVATLPYSTTDTTSNYTDNPTIEGSPGASGCGSTNNYLAGNDVVYAYTATTSGTINVSMTPTATSTFSGIFAYNSCSNIGVNCLAGVANAAVTPRVFDLPVTAGTTYYFVISTWANPTPNFVAYTLVIQTVNCAPPTNLSATNIGQTSADLSWSNPSGATSWEVAVQLAGSPIPSGSGVTTNTNTNFQAGGLIAATNYQYYVRADCGNGTFSAWTGPFPFNTKICDVSQQCNYTFVMRDSFGDGWTGGTMQVRQNGIVVATLTGPLDADNLNPITVTVAMCDGLPFDLFWNNGGTFPGDMGVTIVNSFGQTLYVKAPGVGTAGTVLYTGTVDCLTPACLPATLLTATSISDTSATLGWTSNGPETSWQVIVLSTGSTPPTASETNWVAAPTNPFVYPGLIPGTVYDFYVRPVCSPTSIGAWSAVKTFTTALCPLANQCNYSFIMTDSFGDGWNGGTMQVKQNGIVVATLTGPADADNLNPITVLVPLCHGVPFELYWSNGGTFPAELGISIKESLAPQATIYTKAAGTGTPLTTLFTGTAECIPATCPKPINITFSGVTQTGATVSWTEAGTATQWEVIILLGGSTAPTATSTGVLTSVNPYVFSSLTSATTYDVYIRAICSATDISFWSNKKSFTTLIANDECSNPTIVPVNPTVTCVATAPGSLLGATASIQANTCANTADDDDVWFQFTATSTQHTISLLNLVGSTTDLYHVLYSGACGSLTQLTCNDANSSIANNLVIGQTYYIRVYSNTATGGQTTTFNICVATLPPPITTNTNQYTTLQLVEDIFLNSSCASVTNVTSSTGTNFASTNGIGYFNKNGSNFPFNDGIVLTTGNALSAPGPNTTILSDGANGWTGDAQLEAIILAATGNAMNSKNATKLEFDFVPLVSSINFNFIFASEEYGTFQCTFSDAFAFLLTDIASGITTNIAVVPTTTTPISVVTVRDQLYNNGCASVNAQYFGEYYGATGLDPLTSPTNFNGRTTPLTATANVTPGNQYHIKLVIADRQDTLYDSAVFLEGGSLDIGNVDLGTDFLQSTNNALCAGDIYTIESGLDPTTYTFTWTFNGNPIANETSPDLIITQSGVYGISAQYTNTTCAAIDTITVEYYPQIVPGTPINLTACDNSGFSQFDLSQNDLPSLGSLDPSQYTLSYYDGVNNADAGANALPTLYTNTVANLQTLYVRIENNGSHCFEVRPFDLIVNPLTTTTFSFPTSVCQSSVAPILPTTSDNGFAGTWSPATIDTTTPGSYTFTPTNGCASTVTTAITLITPTTPTFSLGTAINTCVSSTTQVLPTTSIEGVQGTWSPATLDYSIVGQTIYLFTPNANQCATTATLTVDINDKVLPTFTAVAAICNGDALNALPTTSNNSYTGTWTPALDNTTTTLYTFTPTAPQCATTATLTITVNQKVTATFNPIAQLCIGETAPALPATSLQGYTGTWSPSTIDNTASGVYTFTPDAGQCANNGTIPVTVQNGFDFEITANCVNNNYTLEVVPLSNSFDVTLANYTWYNSNLQAIGTNSNLFSVTDYLASTPANEIVPIDFSVEVTTVDGCIKSHLKTLDKIFCDFQKGISINNTPDGKNDTFDLSTYNVKQLSIFDRYGMKVYTKGNYTNQWAGQSDKGDELPDGTYYYVIDFNDNQSAKTGWIYINREQ